MKLSVQINEGPYQHQASDSAYQFIKAALDKGHEIFRVFFYHDGENADNIAPGFRISGLGQLIEAGIQSDRLVVFGD